MFTRFFDKILDDEIYTWSAVKFLIVAGVVSFLVLFILSLSAITLVQALLGA